MDSRRRQHRSGKSHRLWARYWWSGRSLTHLVGAGTWKLLRRTELDQIQTPSRSILDYLRKVGAVNLLRMLQEVDRRVLYALLLLSVTIPFFLNIKVPVPLPKDS